MIAALHNTTRTVRKPSTWLLASLLCVAAGSQAAADPITWDTPIQWTPWDSAVAKATAENKPICLVVYADWCPKCRALAPLFKDPKLLAAANDAVMVLQNHDEKPDWLDQRFGEFGNYVPRIFFLDKAGNVDRSITSGHPRFPYFYRANPEGLSQLVGSLQTAAKKAGGPVQAAAPQAAAPVIGAVGSAQTPPVQTPPAQPASGQPASGQPASGQGVAVVPAQGAPAAPVAPEQGSDLPMMLGLVVAALGAVWFFSRGS